MKKIIVAATCIVMSGLAMAKLPPLSDEAKVKAEQAKAKTAWSDKVAAYKLCLAQDRAAAAYLKSKLKSAAAAAGVPACQDPGPFVMPEALALAAPAPANAALSAAPAATVASAAPAPASKPAAKK